MWIKQDSRTFWWPIWGSVMITLIIGRLKHWIAPSGIMMYDRVSTILSKFTSLWRQIDKIGKGRVVNQHYQDPLLASGIICHICLWDHIFLYWPPQPPLDSSVTHLYSGKLSSSYPGTADTYIYAYMYICIHINIYIYMYCHTPADCISVSEQPLCSDTGTHRY